jgi:hypothetical protein
MHQKAMQSCPIAVQIRFGQFFNNFRVGDYGALFDDKYQKKKENSKFLGGYL